MKQVLLSVIISCLFTDAFASTIVIYITPDFVVMAADSKGIYTNAKTFKEESRTVPKIFKTGNYYFSITGIVSNTTRSFDVSKIINGRLKNAADINTGIEQIKEDVKAALKTYLSYNKKHNPVLFKKDMEMGNYVTSIGIIGIMNHKPYAHILGFKVMNINTLELKTEEDYCPSDDAVSTVYYLGKSDAIKKRMDTLKHITEKPEVFVEGLMLLQIKKTPQYVGLPIDIIKMTPKETVWIRRKESTPVEFK